MSVVVHVVVWGVVHMLVHRSSETELRGTEHNAHFEVVSSCTLSDCRVHCLISSPPLPVWAALAGYRTHSCFLTFVSQRQKCLWQGYVAAWPGATWASLLTFSGFTIY